MLAMSHPFVNLWLDSSWREIKIHSYPQLSGLYEAIFSSTSRLLFSDLTPTYFLAL
jgi:hypothetical protein